MKLEEKNAIINSLAENLEAYSHFYLTDTAQLNAAVTSALRRECFNKDIKMIVVKNTLLKRAMEQSGKNLDELFGVLKGSTSIMFSNTGNVPAKLIKEFRKKNDKPVLKGAYVEESFYTWSGKSPLQKSSPQKALTILRQLSRDKTSMNQLAHFLFCPNEAKKAQLGFEKVLL